MADPLDGIRAGMLNIRAQLAYIQAGQEAMLGVVLDVANRAGVERIEGMPVREFYQRTLKAQLDDLLRAIEDRNPGGAAGLMAIIDGGSTRFPET